MKDLRQQVVRAIAQCLTWNTTLDPKIILNDLQDAAATLHAPFDTIKTAADLEQLAQAYPALWSQGRKVGLVYGGATKIKQYVFESTDLQEIRGASALLDRINLIDLPAFFKGEQDGDKGEQDGDRFPQCRQAASYCEQVRSGWLQQNFPKLVGALTPEMVIYSTGGNILAFCPEDLVDDLADAIEKRYTTETLTANACAVGDSFYPLEIYLGLLKDPIGTTPWLDTVQANRGNVAMQTYFGFNHDADTQAVAEAFRQRKGFSELAGKLANQFNQRRSGYDTPSSLRPSRRYPPMFETHPYVMRDDSDRRSLMLDLNPASVLKNNPEGSPDKLLPEEVLPDHPKFSEPSARKRWIGQVTKRENSRWRAWYRKTELLKNWNPIQVLDDELKAQGRELTTEEELKRREDLFRVGLSSWVNRFEQFLFENNMIDRYDLDHGIFAHDQSTDDGRPNILDYYTREARSLTEIGAASDGFVAYIYADGNNMGAYIRDRIKTPEDYERFSQDVFKATEQSVYWALAHHVHPYKYTPDAKSSRDNQKTVWIHPFEIITIGGDDVLLIVPANKALEVARAIGEEFEQLLSQWHIEIPLEDAEQRLAEDRNPYMVATSYDPDCVHRNSWQAPFCPIRQNQLSISSGVLITAENTPIYYADKLVTQLLKSAKKKAKTLKAKGYTGGTVDFLTLKAVTMISSNIEAFRQEGLTVRFQNRQQELKLYAAPYTLHELGGLIKTVQAVKKADFPKSQLYQVRSLLERGKRTAILNYRYFRVRLQRECDRTLLKEQFEYAWCEAVTNPGSLAPWMPDVETTCKNLMILLLVEAIPDENFIWKHRFLQMLKKYTYRTIWREIVDLYPFIEVFSENDDDTTSEVRESASNKEVPS